MFDVGVFSEIPIECQSYNTTYNTTIGNIERIDITGMFVTYTI